MAPQVEDLVRKLKDAKMDPPSPTKTPRRQSPRSRRAPEWRPSTVTDAGGTQTLEVRKDKDKNYYAKSSVVEGIYKVPNDLGDGLDKAPDDFRNKKLFDFGFSDPTKVELQGSARTPYAKAGDKWMSGQSRWTTLSVQTLIDKLRDLAAIKFAGKGGSATRCSTLTVSPTTASASRRSRSPRQANQYFAQRENEPQHL